METPNTAIPNGPPQKWQRGFWGLMGTQFQGVLSENGLKQLVIFLVMGMGLQEGDRDQLVLIVGALFALPFILFSMAGGFLADRFSKRSVTIGTKALEVIVMVLAIAGLAQHNVTIEFVAIFLASTQAALFGPSKYGLLSELLPEAKLSWGNGLLELGTFLGVIVGTIAAGVMADAFGTHQEWSGTVFLALSLVGLVCSLGISRVPPAAPNKKFVVNPLADLWHQSRLIGEDRVLRLAVLGNTYFWALATLLTANIAFYGQDILHLSDTRKGLLQVAIGVGIGLGSLAAGYLSGDKVEYGLIPLGSFGLSLFGILLSLPNLSFALVLSLLAVLGFFAGFFAVPINALIQHRPAEQDKGGVIAASNWISWVGVGGATALYYGLQHFLKLGPSTIFLVASLATVAATAYVLYVLPDAMLRLVLWMVTRTFYRLRIVGRENLPQHGGALLAPNHVSFADAALMLAATDRPIRFVMFKDIYDNPLIKPFAKIMGVIPISSQQGPREMIQSLRAATEALRNGEVVCIFPEGQLTRTGQMMPFRRGMERIVKGLDVPIIPVNMDGIWGSIFSFKGGRFLSKLPSRIPYPVTIAFGKPLPATATAQQVRQVVQELGADSYAYRKRYMPTLGRSFVHSCRSHPRGFAMADGRTPSVKFGSLLTRTIFLARRLRSIWSGQKMVGILLPPSVGGAMVNYAALLMGKVPVNLNYTASTEVLKSCAQQCELQTVITSKAFLERVHIEVPARAVMLEDLIENPSFAEKLAAALIAWLLPARLLEKAVGGEKKVELDDVATVIFSSGSTGDPKGVALTHYNLASNVDQINQIFMLDGSDSILGILPFFHSFGFMATLCLPASIGMGVVFHYSPLDAKAIGALVSKYGVTFLLATPTFLQGYTRRIEPEAFGSLKFVLAGAEKLAERVALAFEDRFGIRPLEGYGCTECSPVVTVNTRDFRAAAVRQVGAKRGSIGHQLPGISVKIVDPDTREPRPQGETGLLLVKGPNIMQGYLQRPAKTAEVLQDGWYNTGDIASVDEDGFLWITDRLSRFSKIGGEMVPHIKVEDKLQELAGVTEQVFVVTSLPDEKKGERLVVIHTVDEVKLLEHIAGLAQCDLPSLWKPKRDQFVRVDALPYLGTGKLDLRRVRELAQAGQGQVVAAQGHLDNTIEE